MPKFGTDKEPKPVGPQFGGVIEDIALPILVRRHPRTQRPALYRVVFRGQSPMFTALLKALTRSEYPESFKALDHTEEES